MPKRITLRSRIASVAGRNVRLPTTEMNTTAMDPTAIDLKTSSSIRSRAPSEIITARPLKKTALPAVELATSIAPSLSRPAERSVRKRDITKSE